MAFTLNDLARSYLFFGQLNQAHKTAREAWQIWRELENEPMLADNLALSSQIAFYTGHYDQALSYSDEAFEISDRTYNNWGRSYSQLLVGNVHWEYGRPTDAIAATADAVRFSGEAGFVAGQVMTRATLGMIYAELGAFERGLDLIKNALDIVSTAAQFHRASVLATLAQINLWHDNLAEAEATIEGAKTDPNRTDLPLYVLPVILIDGELALRQKDYVRVLETTDELFATLDRYGMRRYLPDGLYLQGQALLALGHNETAYECLLEARAVAEAIGSQRMLWRILLALSQAEPNSTEAERLHQQAREVVAYIADHTPADLRDSFLSLPEVRVIKIS
jgi:tetratricopeptide (TPR) repeat protein